MKIKFHSNECFSCCPTSLREALTLLANVTWAGDVDCDEANGPEFKQANGEADTFLRAHGMYPSYETETNYNHTSNPDGV